MCRRHLARERHLGSRRGRIEDHVRLPRPELRTHCPQGHPYDETNTAWTGPKRQYRTCRECQRAAQRELRARKRGLELDA